MFLALKLAATASSRYKAQWSWPIRACSVINLKSVYHSDPTMCEVMLINMSDFLAVTEIPEITCKFSQ